MIKKILWNFLEALEMLFWLLYWKIRVPHIGLEQSVQHLVRHLRKSHQSPCKRGDDWDTWIQWNLRWSHWLNMHRDHCLIQSLGLLAFLARRGVPARLFIGVQKRDQHWQGHAWIESPWGTFLKPMPERFKIIRIFE